MLDDFLDQLAAAYAVTTQATHIQTASIIDRLVPMEDGAGAPLYFKYVITTSVTTSASGTWDAQLLGNASDPTFGSGNVVLFDSLVQSAATGVKGYRQCAVIPRQAISAAYEAIGIPLRYYAFAVIIGTGALTAGAWSAWLSNGPFQDNLAYQAGYTA